MPTLANPSVQRITEEPGLPLEATSIADTNAGPKAVCPLASVLFKLFINPSNDIIIGSFILNPAKELIIDYLLYNLSPTIFIVLVLLSPKTVT
jgi:hypothetical protein